ncbi:MAG TPA: tetratricopeptide repeat protein [Rectinemataceae bacterium]|nr:tetratricopeptide repeat protein [Rectinemataceae bacterium]
MTWLSIPKISLSDAVSGIAPYWKTRAEIGYRFGPSFDVSASLGYLQILGSQTPIYKGLSAGAVLRLGLDGLLGSASGLSAKVETVRSVFPIIWYRGKSDPIMKIKVVNEEAAEIRDVKVTFSAGEYTSRAADCGSFRLIVRAGSVEVPIYADFSDRVLAFSETTKVQGLVRVDYRVLDARRSFSYAVTVVFNNRNAATWADDRVIGAFVSPQDPAMLELSKYVAGLVRVAARPEIDKYLQYGMGLFEALRIYGVSFSPDPVLPYAAARRDVSKLGYIQYPWQTLSYKSGDSDALALLFAEALESVAVPAAIAALPEDCIVAFPLDMDEAKARTTFETISNFIFASGKVWVPLRASMIREGFLPAWKAGADLWNKSLQRGEAPKLVPLLEAWKEFQPIAIPDIAFTPIKPSESAVTMAFESTLERFVDVEVGPKVKRLTSAFEGKGTARQHNGLGIVYAQYGMYAEARAEFEKASALGSVPAIVNLANVAFLMKDYESAAVWFQKALANDPNNKAALIGLARSRYELDAYADADSLFARVKAMDPSLAERYAYLSSKIDGSSALRASSAAADRGGGMLWDGGE